MDNYISYDNTNYTSTDLVNAVLVEDSGLNIDLNSVRIQYGVTYGDTGSISFYTPDENKSLNIDSGIFLSTGTSIPNQENTSSSYSDSLSSINGTSLSDSDLSETATLAFSGSGSINDASVLEFDFTISDLFVHGITFDLVFASEEYPEYSDSSFVDIAGVYLNNQNIALFNGNDSQPLSVISENLYANNFIDNSSDTFPVEFDGVSNKLTIYAPVQPGVNTLKIAIADTGDSAYDSGLYIANLSGTQLKGTGLSSVTSGTADDDVIYGDTNNQTFDLGDGNDYIDPGLGSNIVLTGSGDDTILSGSGFNQIDGGEGYDSVLYSNLFNNMLVKILDNDTISIGDNQDYLLNIENIQFSDLSLDSNKMLIEDDVSKVYIAYFGRSADNSGMDYWVTQVNNAVNNSTDYSKAISDVVSAFADSTEAEKIYPGITSGNLSEEEMTTFINNIYLNLFDRNADTLGLDYWVSEGLNLQDANTNLGTIVKTIIDGAQDLPDQLDRTFMQNKSQVSWYYAKQQELNDILFTDEVLQESIDILSSVTSEVISVNDLYTQINNLYELV